MEHGNTNMGDHTMIKTGHKSPQATRNRIKQKKIKIASERKRIMDLRSKPLISFTVNAKPLCDALKQAWDMINNAFDQLKEGLSKMFPVPAMLKFYLELQMADNARPNKYLIGWGRG